MVSCAVLPGTGTVSVREAGHGIGTLSISMEPFIPGHKGRDCLGESVGGDMAIAWVIKGKDDQYAIDKRTWDMGPLAKAIIFPVRIAAESHCDKNEGETVVKVEIREVGDE